MSVVLIGGEKGGTGKSTLATNLAVMRSLMGRDVILIDADKQASSYKFIANRHQRNLKPTPTCIQLRGKYLNKEIEDLMPRYQDIIIDAGGQDSVELRSAMGSPAVKKLITPLQPSQFDLETLTIMDDLTYTAKSFNQHLEAYILFNHAPTHSKISVAQEAKEAAASYENIKILDIVISHRVNFQYAASDAMCVVEFEAERFDAMPAWQQAKYIPKATLEIIEFYKQIYLEDFSNLFYQQIIARQQIKDKEVINE